MDIGWNRFAVHFSIAPFVRCMSSIANGILRICGFSGKEHRTIVHEGDDLPVKHKRMLSSLLDLEQASVEDMMIPKADIVGIDLERPWHQLLEQLETTKHHQLPLYRHSIDHIVGMVHLRRVLQRLLKDELTMETLLSVSEPPYFIPEATPLNVQLLHFQKMKKRSGFVVDEYGELQGLVTMEAILEEIAGEFTKDIATMSRDIIAQADGSVIIDASITIRQLNRAMGWQLPLSGPRTLSGLIIEYLGYIPPADCCLRIDTFQIDILKVGEKTIKSVRMTTAANSAHFL